MKPVHVFTAAMIGAACVLSACSPAGTTARLALNTPYHPKFLPATEVIKAGETAGSYAGMAYICGDADCKTAIRRE